VGSADNIGCFHVLDKLSSFHAKKREEQ